ncbi:cytochrome p450 [Stagonosporopsis vannaccii]|nr:cytochrome p450 [Stagonosporopsis vannaccii]
MRIELFTLAFGFGVASHVLLFSRGEWDRHSPKVLFAHILLNTAIFAAFILRSDWSLSKCLMETYLVSFVVISGVVGSMLVYRLFLHPLRSFPGPLEARVSSFWVFRKQWPDLKLYIKLRDIHNHYGDFVRIKPREISICHPDAVNDIHGPRSRIRKGEFYEQIHPAHSLQFTRNPSQHKAQRRYWDKAFQTKALQEYSPRIVKHYRRLLDIFCAKTVTGVPIDVSTWFMDLFFDVVSDLTFGESFNTLTTGERNPVIGEFLQNQKIVGFALLNMWIFHLIRSIPAVAARLLYMMQWYASAISRRKEVRERSSHKRQWYANALKQREQSDTFDVDGIHEAQLAIIAGADTNAITVSNACYLLCRYPEYQKQLFGELRDLPFHGDIVDDGHLLHKPILSSVINETLRLYPPVPGGLQRVTPPEGATIAGRYVPGETVVSTPTYALHRDSRSFVRPNDFVPERWTSQPSLILRKDTFIPFSYGTYNCAGKPLAMMQLRMVIAMVVKKFEMSFAPGKEEECERYIHNQADCFTLHLRPLPLMLKERVKQE